MGTFILLLALSGSKLVTTEDQKDKKTGRRRRLVLNKSGKEDDTWQHGKHSISAELVS